MSIMSVEELQHALQSATQRCETQRAALRTLYAELQEHTTKFDAIYIPPPRSLDLLHTISSALSSTAAPPSSSALSPASGGRGGARNASHDAGTPLHESIHKDTENVAAAAAPRTRPAEAGLVPSQTSLSQLSCPHSAQAAPPPRRSTPSRRSLSIASSISGLHGAGAAAPPGTTQLRNNEPPPPSRSASQRSAAHSSSYGGVVPQPSQAVLRQQQQQQQPPQVQQQPPSSTHASSSAGIHPISPWMPSEPSRVHNNNNNDEEEEPKQQKSRAEEDEADSIMRELRREKAEEEKGEEEGEEQRQMVPSIVKSSRDEAREAVAAEMQAYDGAQRQQEEEGKERAKEQSAKGSCRDSRAATPGQQTPLRHYYNSSNNNNYSTSHANATSAALQTANSSHGSRPSSRHVSGLPQPSAEASAKAPEEEEEEVRGGFHAQPVVSTSTPHERAIDTRSAGAAHAEELNASRSRATPVTAPVMNHTNNNNNNNDASHAITPTIYSASAPAFYVVDANETAAAAQRARAAVRAVLGHGTPQYMNEPEHGEERKGSRSPVRSLADQSQEALRPIQPSHQNSHASKASSLHKAAEPQAASSLLRPPSTTSASSHNHYHHQSHHVPSAHPSNAAREEGGAQDNREPIAPNAAPRSHSTRSGAGSTTSALRKAAAAHGGSEGIATPRRKRPNSPLRRPREPGLTHHQGSQILVPSANQAAASNNHINTTTTSNSSSSKNTPAAAGLAQASPAPHGSSPEVRPRALALRPTPSAHLSPNSQELTVTRPRDGNSQPLSTQVVVPPHALRTATPRRCVGSGMDSGQVEKALYGGRIIQPSWPGHVVEDAPGVREFMEAEGVRLRQREERDREARSPSLAFLQQQQKLQAQQRSGSTGANARPRMSSGALIPVEDALQVTRAPPPSLTERQLLLERAQLANQLDKMFKEMVITMRRYDETGLEARYAQLNQRIARVQDDLKRVETEINMVQNLERKAQRRTISPF